MVVRDGRNRRPSRTTRTLRDGRREERDDNRLEELAGVDSVPRDWHLHVGEYRLPGPLAGLLTLRQDAKSHLRNHHWQAIVQPRLYDCLMVTQITLNAVVRLLDGYADHSSS